MSVERCPHCNKILSPQESVCSNCGKKVKNPNIGKINSIYHKSNVATLIFFAVFLVVALIYAFVDWILAIIVGVVLMGLFMYLIFKR
ncbi:zinc ribbon domain-containing protein [uncultured Methanobrevibacter sp.]|uniref:zinc ribbon domain-containing protein n=1 Tax=uncultured Methanobrevibacter sp. TaxID=253161 RepID=UPI0025E5C48B|nr:zinc ribbon domain-containing protein [uncultured Methanobrevibacter sp.]